MSELEQLREDLAEVDDLLDQYGIDVIGTGRRPSKKEQARVCKIIESVERRIAERKTPSESNTNEVLNNLAKKIKKIRDNKTPLDYKVVRDGDMFTIKGPEHDD